MLKFDVHLGFFYGDKPFADRFAAATADGFKAVEMLSPYEDTPDAVRKLMEAQGQQCILFNSPAGDWNAGERGIAVLEDREADFLAAVDTIVQYATALNCKRINFMAGINKKPEPVYRAFGRLVDRYRHAADVFAKHGITLLLEHINNYDFPGYFVGTPARAFEVIKAVNRDNAMIQFDVYHAQRAEGEVVDFLRNNFDMIGHIQVADNPGRNQPGTGEVNYDFIFTELERLNYQGWIGLEYKPTPNSAASLGWMKKWVK